MIPFRPLDLARRGVFVPASHPSYGHDALTAAALGAWWVL